MMNQNMMDQNMMGQNMMNNNQFMMNNLNKEGRRKDNIIIDNSDDLFILNQINIRKKQFENQNQNGVTIFINRLYFRWNFWGTCSKNNLGKTR